MNLGHIQAAYTLCHWRVVPASLQTHGGLQGPMAILELGSVIGGLHWYLTRTWEQDQTLFCDHQEVSSFPGMIFGPCQTSRPPSGYGSEHWTGQGAWPYRQDHSEGFVEGGNCMEKGHHVGMSHVLVLVLRARRKAEANWFSLVCCCSCSQHGLPSLLAWSQR